MTPMSNQTRPAAGPTTSSTACEPALSNFVTTPATEGGARSKKMSRQAYAPGKEWMQHRILDGGRRLGEEGLGALLDHRAVAVDGGVAVVLARRV